VQHFLKKDKICARNQHVKSRTTQIENEFGKPYFENGSLHKPLIEISID
jgi:hypothetical protein